MNRSQVLSLFKDQHDAIAQTKTIKLNSLSPPVKLHVLVDLIDEYLSSFEPPIVLERLSLQNNQISDIPSNLFKISKHLKYLDLYHNNISHISSSIFHNGLKSLEILDLSSNQISYLPESISQLHNLKVLSVKNNNIRYLTPSLGELQHLNLIEVSNNPLSVPSFDLIQTFQAQTAELDWVGQLKNYLLANRTVINARIEESRELSPTYQGFQTMDPKHSHESQITPPSVQRSQSVSDLPKSKSSKASKRMGFIIKKLEENGSEENFEEQRSVTTSTTISRPIIHEGAPHSASAAETKFIISSPPPPQITTTSSTAPSSASSSPSNDLGLSTPKSNLGSHLKPPASRSRSNTMKEIDRILEKNENVDTEHMSNAYFKRLSTLQEQPVDESEVTDSPTSNQRATPRQIMETNPRGPPPSLPSAVPRSSTSGTDDGSPMRPYPSSKKQVNPNIVKVSRKVLFSFSELHSSIRRFTGFCTEKKITMKMVSLLYTTKSNIDSLVENLEIMEETGNNADQIASTLQTCITSFRSIMDLLQENLTKFINKIDVCFIRMLYLSVFGSFNELKNAYILLTAKPKVTEFKSKLTINTNVGSSFDEVDEKLYATVESAIANAQPIFTELNKDVHRGANANAASVSSSVVAKIKDLTNVCGSSLDITERLNTKLIAIRNNPSHGAKKSFAEDTNQFLKSIVSILAAVKSIVVDIPILEDVRAPMSNLTKTAKEVTYMLEISSYKTLLSDSGTISNQQMQSASVNNQNSSMFTPVSAHAPSLPSAALFTNGPVPMRNPTSVLPNLSTANLQDTSSNSLASDNGPLTAPPQSSGQIFAKNGMNPFDKLILSKREET
ncbi:SOG2 [Candida margitis]|uniref:SOG2 n=1 Tax=Candida margitis TaxID=1775924 RepID=UPI0022270D46|nr:SOG2 [Candida margitis]KAI5969958.1 SOG2 [Candida margitis]